MSDDPTEHAQEHIQHEAAHSGGHGPTWITAAALTAAFLAAFAAVSSSLATKHLTESTLTRIEANDTWLEFDSDKVKQSNIYTRDEQWALAPVDQRKSIASRHDDDQLKKAEYGTKPEDEENKAKPKGLKGLQLMADGLEKLSASHLDTHETYEMSATMFHIAIAIVAIAVVAKRKEFWYVSMVGGVVGMVFFGVAFSRAPAEEKHETEAAQVAPAGEHGPAVEHAPASTHAPAAEHAPADKPIETH